MSSVLIRMPFETVGRFEDTLAIFIFIYESIRLSYTSFKLRSKPAKSCSNNTLMLSRPKALITY